MSKPQDFNKKELEKRRMQKRKEKEERKEQRKSESKDGKSFEDMLAYVDENGNITSTPPDPTRKKAVISESEVNLESRNKGGAAAPDERRTGRVTFFNEKKGFGFIRDDASKDSVFVHINALEANVAENTAVTFEVERTVKGLSAVRVRLKT